MSKAPFIFTFQNSCSNVAVATFTPSDNGGKQAFTVTGYTLSDYFDEGDDLAFNYSGAYYVYTIIDITGNQITMSFDYNAAITNGNTTLQFSVKSSCNPLQFYLGKFQWEKDKDNYFMRMKYSGKVIFKNDDYTYLYSALNDQCCNVLFKVYKLCDGEYSLYYRSNITRFEGTWNESQCTIESELPPVDKYECILANADIDVNIYEVEQDFTNYFEDDFSALGSGQGPFFEFLVRATVPVAPSDIYTPASGADFKQLQGDGGYTNDPVTGNPWTIYARALMVVTYIGDPINFVVPTIVGWTPDTANEIRAGGQIIVRYTQVLVNGNEPNFTQGMEVPGTGGDCEFEAAQALALYDPVNDNCIYVDYPNSGFITAYNSVRMDAVISLMAAKCNNIQLVTSDFFDYNAIGDTPGYSAGINYVTGYLNYVANNRISAMSDVLNAGGDTALYLNYSFKRLMRDLNYMFNVYWFIDSEHRLRIEHDSWFINNLIVNVSSYSYNKYMKSYTFIKEDTPNREKFTFKYAQNADFVGADIIYSDVCTKSPTTLLRASEVTTDIHYLRNAPSGTFSPDGIVMFATDGANLLYEPGRLTGTSLQNNHLSWANLQYNYHMYGRIIESGLLNYVDTNFTTWKKRKKQSGQKYLSCCLEIPENMGQVTTELGTGDAPKITFDINSNTYEFELNQP